MLGDVGGGHREQEDYSSEGLWFGRRGISIPSGRLRCSCRSRGFKGGLDQGGIFAVLSRTAVAHRPFQSLPGQPPPQNQNGSGYLSRTQHWHTEAAAHKGLWVLIVFST